MAKAKRGRPRKYSEKLAAKLCAKLAQGMSLRTACKEKDMPGMTTVFEWLHDIPDFAEQYTRAKEESADALAEEILDISDDGRNDWMERYNKDGEAYGWKVNGEAVQRSKLRVDSRKWLMAKMKPKRYGDALDLTTGGEKLIVETRKHNADADD